MSRYGNLGSFDYKVTNVPQYDLEADIDRSMATGMKFGAMIGQGIQKGREKEANKAITRQKEIANQLALDKIDAATREGLILKADDDAGALNDSRIDFSNMLVDRLNQAKISRDNGSLTAADYSKVVMTLESQIPAYKAAEKILYADIATYMESVENDNQSGANDPKTIEFLSAMSTGRADVSYAFDKNNKMQLTGTWTDSEGNKQPIEAAIEKFEQLPRVLTAPENTAFEQREADIANIMETKRGAAMSKITSKTDPVTGVPMYESTIDPLTVEVDGKQVLKPWFKQSADDSFNGYFDSLGNGDLRMGLKSYLLDSTQSEFGYEEVSEMIDGKKDKNGNIIEPTNMDTLKFLKEQIKEDYAQNMLEETLAANKLKVAELQQKNTGDLANIKKDESSIMIATERERKLREEAASKKGSGQNAKSSDALLNRVQGLINKSTTFGQSVMGPVNKSFNYEDIIKDTGINISNAKITETKGGFSQTTTDPNNFVMDVPGGKTINISKEDLNDSEQFIRNYLAALGVPNKATKTQPSIDDYLDSLDFTGKGLMDKYGIK
jgi:hypothetical protein